MAAQPDGDAAESTGDHPLNAPGIAMVLQIDLPCIQCGYNLRSLPRQGHCPECHASVSASLRADRLAFLDPVWLAGMLRGLGVIFWTLVMTAVLLVGLPMAEDVWIQSGRPLPGDVTVVHTFTGGSWATGSFNILRDLVPIVANTLCVLALMTGVWLATRPASANAALNRAHSRRAGRVFAMASVLAALAPFVCIELVRTKVHKFINDDSYGVQVTPAMPTLRYAFEVACGVGVALVTAAMLLWLASIARRMPSTALVRWATALAILASLVFASRLLSPLFAASPGGAFGRAFEKLISVAVIVSICGCAVFIFIYRRQVKTTILACATPTDHPIFAPAECEVS